MRTNGDERLFTRASRIMKAPTQKGKKQMAVDRDSGAETDYYPI